MRASGARGSVFYWCAVYGVSVIFVVGHSICLQLGTLRAAKRMHNAVLNIVVRSKMAFFDTTPIGRILNRFSGDIFVFDQTLPSLLAMFMSSASRVFILFSL